MKKYIVALLAVLGMAGVASAQRFEFQGGYGGYTQMDATNMADNMNVNTAWGAATAGVNFRVNSSMRIGASYTFSTANYKDNAPGTVYYNVVLFSTMYDYYRAGGLNLYSHAAVGMDFSHMTSTNPHWSYNNSYFAYQVSPIGAEYYIGSGCKLFGELGFGAQGLLQIGVRVGL